MAHKKSWSAVYPGLTSLPPTHTSRIGTNVLLSDVTAICGVAANNSVISHIIQHAIKSTADYVRIHKLSYLDADAFIAYLCRRGFIDPLCESPVGQPPTETPSPDESGRDSGVLDRVADVKALPPIVGEATKGGLGGKGSQGGRTSSPRAAKKR